jgi:hypothetical protein
MFVSALRCFVDAQITGSPSTFLPRENDVTLRFQMEAFRMQGSAEGLVKKITPGNLLPFSLENWYLEL